MAKLYFYFIKGNKTFHYLMYSVQYKIAENRILIGIHDETEHCLYILFLLLINLNRVHLKSQ